MNQPEFHNRSLNDLYECLIGQMCSKEKHIFTTEIHPILSLFDSDEKQLLQQLIKQQQNIENIHVKTLNGDMKDFYLQQELLTIVQEDDIKVDEEEPVKEEELEQFIQDLHHPEIKRVKTIE